jgi:hypothetical protein
MSRATLVRATLREEYTDMAGLVHPTYAQAFQSSVRGLLASFLADQGVEAVDAVAAALLERFVVVPRDSQ